MDKLELKAGMKITSKGRKGTENVYVINEIDEFGHVWFTFTSGYSGITEDRCARNRKELLWEFHAGTIHDEESDLGKIISVEMVE